MLSVEIIVLEDGLPIDGYSQGHIKLKGEYGEVATSGSVMIFITLTALLDQVREFIVAGKERSELSLGIDSWFEPCLFRKKEYFSFTNRSQEIVNKSSKSELITVILEEAEKIHSKYSSFLPSDDSAAIGLTRALQRFRDAFPFEL